MSKIMFCRALYSVLLSIFLFAASPFALADTKNYTVTAPDGVKLAVQESGNPDGAAIIFIHGFLGSHLNWDAQINSPDLQRFRLITYDLRGHGLSGKPTNVKAYNDGQRWADDLAAVIRSSHARKPVLVGWSLGGAVISNYLAKFGDSRIAGAVYVDGVIEIKPEQLVPHPGLLQNLDSPDLKIHLDAVREFLSLCFHTRPDTATYERLLANAAMSSWDMERSALLMDTHASQGLGKARVPILLIYGGHDALVNAKTATARAVALDPRIQSKLYADSGHASFMEESDRFDRDLVAFIATTSTH